MTRRGGQAVREGSPAYGGTSTKYLAPNEIYSGDARDLLEKIRPASVQLSLWSPPYFVGKSYEQHMTYEEWQQLIQEVISQTFATITPGGFMVVNIADILCFRDDSMPKVQADNLSHKKVRLSRQDVERAKMRHPTYSRYQLAALLGCSEQTIQRRLEHNNVRGGKHTPQTRVQIVGGMIQDWAMRAGFYPYDRRIWVKDPAWENSRWHTNSYRAVDEFEYLYIFWRPGITCIRRERLAPYEWADWGSRAVWNIRSVRKNDDHEAKFPAELVRRIVRLLTDRNGLVVDPFVGSGTTAVVAAMEGREFIGIEIVPSYASLARRKVQLSQLKELS